LLSSDGGSSDEANDEAGGVAGDATAGAIDGVDGRWPAAPMPPAMLQQMPSPKPQGQVA